MERLIGIIVLPAEDVVNFFVSLALALVLGLAVAAVYRITHRGMNYESGFLSTLVLLVPIVAVVMILIQGDLVLSLGLVGSLAIIRFRTPIKDTRDMVFLFWSIAVGLGVGTLNWTIAVLSTLVLSIAMGVIFVLKYGKPLHEEYILVVSGDDPYDDSVDQAVRRRPTSVQLRNHEVDGDAWEVTYELRLARANEEVLREMVADLRELGCVRKVSLLAPQLTLPM